MNERQRDVHKVTATSLVTDDTRDWLKARGNKAVVVDDAVLFSKGAEPVRMAVVGDVLVYGFYMPDEVWIE